MATDDDRKAAVRAHNELARDRRRARSRRRVMAAETLASALLRDSDARVALLRAEAAAKASAEDALKSTEDELQSVKHGKSALARELAGLRLSEKDEMKRDSMLSKQLELMDEKYATLLRTNNFNRAREARESKALRAKMHTMAESMHAMMLALFQSHS